MLHGTESHDINDKHHHHGLDGMSRGHTMGATVVLMGTPSLEKTAASAVLKMPRLLRSISTCAHSSPHELFNPI